jgi:hypothetical protein
MKVFIGKYKNWVGPYQIADLLQKVGVSEDRCHEIGEKLSETWLQNICVWIEDKRPNRKVKVKIHNYDHWNAYHTLAEVIHPVLVSLRANKHGSGGIDDADVPEKLRTTSAEPKENDWDSDSNVHVRYEWALDEMIFAFANIIDDSWEDTFDSGVIDFYFEPCNDGSGCSEMMTGPNHTHVRDNVGYTAYQDRIQHGTYLFGKYFQTLWD